MAISKIVTNSVDSGVTLTSPVINTITSAAATALTLQSAGTTAITVDTSQRVTMSAQPTFSGGRNAGDVAINTTFIMNNAYVNNGNCYNTTTGIFTCPVLGYYMITFSVATSAGYAGNQDFFFILLNGTAYVSNYTAGLSVQFQRGSGEIILYCAANDTINFKTGGVAIYGGSAQHSYGTIRLLG